MIKKISVCLCVLFLIGCKSSEIISEEPKPNIDLHHILLQDKNGNSNGVGIAFEKNWFLSLRPSNEKNPEIFWQKESIPFQKQFLEENILFFEFHKKDVPLFNDIKTDILIGEEVYWFSGAETLSGTISGISEKEITISGNTTPLSQGSPIFTKDQSLIGILSKADPQNNSLIGIKIKPILTFWENNK